MFHLAIFRFELILALARGPVPPDTFVMRLNPFLFSFLVVMFIIPALPSGSYFADGLVMTSMFFMDDASI